MLNLENEYIERGINIQTHGVKGNGTLEDLQLMNNIITKAPPKSDIIIPNGSYSFIGGLAPLTDGKNLIGVGKPVLIFQKHLTGTTAVKIKRKSTRNIQCCFEGKWISRYQYCGVRYYR